MPKQQIFDVAVELEAETEKAWLVYDGGPKSVWIPKSQAELEKNPDGSWTLTGPEWLLKDKGLI